ncbi:MAG: PA2169 family four-helix-bundle protein [Ornithinibacter sp.]
MSTDEKTAKDLVETLEDGRAGYAAAAEKLRDSDQPQLAETMQHFSDQRGDFARQIVELGHAYGDDVDDGGSLSAKLHRGWLKMKDAVTGDDAGAVLAAAASGEDHAVSEFEKALDEEDLSPGFRSLVQQQHQSIVAARDQVKALADAA